MNPYIRALRAITATVFQRVYRPLVWIIGGILTLLCVSIIALMYYATPWWGIAFIILIPIILLFGTVSIILWLLSQRLLPRRLMHSERQQILEFSDKLLRVAELRATPLPVIVGLIAKDLIRGKKSSYLEGIIADSGSLKSEFTKIRDLFA